jgi:V/A-type H+-transporting ATPase subunit D
MPDTGNSSPTRSAFLELSGERDLVREGYEFLDEKRMIIAAEMLRQLNAYKELAERYRQLDEKASAALALAAGRHGLEDLSIYPTGRLQEWHQPLNQHRFLGVDLLSPEAPSSTRAPAPDPVIPSIEAANCSRAFAELLEIASLLAARFTNLRRLISEYVRTERRARALENVLLPEIEADLRFMEDQLEAVDQEEALRVRFAGPAH